MQGVERRAQGQGAAGAVHIQVALDGQRHGIDEDPAMFGLLQPGLLEQDPRGRAGPRRGPHREQRGVWADDRARAAAICSVKLARGPLASL